MTLRRSDEKGYLNEGYERPFSRRGYNLDDDDDSKTYTVDNWSPRSMGDFDDTQTMARGSTGLINPGSSQSVLTTSLSVPGFKRGKTETGRSVRDKKYFHDLLLKKMSRIRGEIAKMKDGMRSISNGQTKYDSLAKEAALGLTQAQGLLSDYNALNEWMMTSSDPTIQTMKSEIKQIKINNKEEEDNQETIYNAKTNLQNSIKLFQEKIKEEKFKKLNTTMNTKSEQEEYNRIKNLNDKLEAKRTILEKELDSLVSPDLTDNKNIKKAVALTLKYEELKKEKTQQMGGKTFREENDREEAFMNNEINSLKDKIVHIKRILSEKSTKTIFENRKKSDDLTPLAQSLIEQEETKIEEKSKQIENKLNELNTKLSTYTDPQSNEYAHKVSHLNKLLEAEKNLQSDIENFKTKKTKLQNELQELSEGAKASEDKLLEEKHEYIYLLRSKQKSLNELNSERQKVNSDLKVHPYHNEIINLESKLGDLARENYSIQEFIIESIKEKDVQSLSNQVINKVNRLNEEHVKSNK